jgi:hypothetical protein
MDTGTGLKRKNILEGKRTEYAGGDAAREHLY